MRVSRFGRRTFAALLVLLSSCQGITGPDDDTSRGDFDVLIERRNGAGQRSFYTMSATGKFFAPFTGVPVDAVTLIPSPDGKTIAYLRENNGGVGLWAMDRDGANRRAILDAGAIDVESAAWSPDGTKFVIGYSTAAVTSDIGVVNANGTGLVDLTPDPLPGVYLDRTPSWSPDGKRIAFSSNRSGTARLWTMNADGSNPVCVTTGIPATERNPVWSPDGSFLAALSSSASGSGIMFIRPEGTDYQQFLSSMGSDDPVWLPDGRLLVVGVVAGNRDLYTLDHRSGVTTRLTSRADDDVHAAVLARVSPFAWLGFAAPVTTPINRPFAVDLDVADVITDGRPDLLILSPILNELRLMKGAAGGAFQSVGSLFAESEVFSVATATVTTDLAADIVGRGDSAFYLWRGRADGPGPGLRFGATGLLRDVVAADFNGNGRDDIVAMTELGNQPFRLSMYSVNTADVVVRSSEMTTTSVAGRALCAGDVDGDGRPDLIMLAGATSLSALVSIGHGDLIFDRPAAAGNDLSSDLEATPICADFDGDGADDMALLSIGQTASVSVHLYQSGRFTLPTRISGSASSLAVADVDRDGDLDLVIASASAAQVLIAKNTGDGRFSQPTVVTVPNLLTRLIAADLNGDAWPDIAAIDATGALVLLFSRGRIGM